MLTVRRVDIDVIRGFMIVITMWRLVIIGRKIEVLLRLILGSFGARSSELTWQPELILSKLTSIILLHHQLHLFIHSAIGIQRQFNWYHSTEGTIMRISGFNGIS